MNRTVAETLFEVLRPIAEGSRLIDVRLGLGYSAVRIEGGAAGVCWSPKVSGHTCTAFSMAGTITGRKASEALSWIADKSAVWMRVIGIATANALLNADRGLSSPDGASSEEPGRTMREVGVCSHGRRIAKEPTDKKGDILSLLEVNSQDRVAMVGRFGPLLPDLRKRGCKLDIIELEPHEPDSLTPDQGREALRNCTVAIVTGTTLVTGTLEGILADLEPNPDAEGSERRGREESEDRESDGVRSRNGRRPVVLLGPSVPLCPPAFEDTVVTHLAGSWVTDPVSALKVVSEGGGTPLLKGCLVHACLPVTNRGRAGNVAGPRRT